jgi:ketosteroid isomerase-like protein
MNRWLFRVGCVFLLTVWLWNGFPMPIEAKTQLMPGGIQEVDSETLKELLSTFEQSEQAMQARDVDRIMALYSDDYLYHGLKKADVQKIWEQLFKHYKELESVHTFSVVRLGGPGGKLVAEMTCSGVVWGTSKETTLRSPIDSWYEEVHYLRRENGRWRIVGNVGGESMPVLQFGVAPHPLF